MSTRARDLAATAAVLAERLAGGACGARDAELLDALTILGDVLRLAEATGIELAGVVAERSAGEGNASLARRSGERSPAALIAATARIVPAEASAWVTAAGATSPRRSLTGELLPPRRGALAAAVSSGLVCAAAVARIGSTLDAIARTAAPGVVDSVEETLVRFASEVGLRDLTRLCRSAADRCAPEEVEQREEWLRRNSFVKIWEDPDGLTRLSAALHPEAAAFVRTALDARTAPRRSPSFGDRRDPSDNGVSGSHGGGEVRSGDGQGSDRRGLAERRVDALVGVARTALEADDGRVAGAPVTVVVTVAAETLISGVGVASLSGVDAPLSVGAARRLAADAAVIPVVLGSRSEILDQGRACRVATAAQRRALEVRDGGCLWPGCSAPPGWCETAHLRAWWAGGPTDLANLALLCPFHHRVFDADGWALNWRGGVPYLIPPPHVDSARTPRRAGRPRLAA